MSISAVHSLFSPSWSSICLDPNAGTTRWATCPHIGSFHSPCFKQVHSFVRIFTSFGFSLSFSQCPPLAWPGWCGLGPTLHPAWVQRTAHAAVHPPAHRWRVPPAAPSTTIRPDHKPWRCPAKSPCLQSPAGIIHLYPHLSDFFFHSIIFCVYLLFSCDQNDLVESGTRCLICCNLRMDTHTPVGFTFIPIGLTLYFLNLLTLWCFQTRYAYIFSLEAVVYSTFRGESFLSLSQSL